LAKIIFQLIVLLLVIVQNNNNEKVMVQILNTFQLFVGATLNVGMGYTCVLSAPRESRSKR